MAKIEYADIDHVKNKKLVETIKDRRGRNLYNLDKMLLHSERFAEAWNKFFGTVREQLDINPKIRELAICVVAVVNQAEYEFLHHYPLFIKYGGTMQQVEELRKIQSLEFNPSAFNEIERAVIDLTVEITRNVKIEKITFNRILELLESKKMLIELIGVISAYNMVSRFLVALGIDPE